MRTIKIIKEELKKSEIRTIEHSKSCDVCNDHSITCLGYKWEVDNTHNLYLELEHSKAVFKQNLEDMGKEIDSIFKKVFNISKKRNIKGESPTTLN